jgi:hypothetical protein
MLTPENKARVRRHLGYPSLSAASTFFLGNPAAMEPFFILENAMDALINSGEGLVLRHLDKLDELAEVLFYEGDTDVVKNVGDIEINPDQFFQTVRRYKWFQAEVANAFQVGPNPFDQRFTGMAGFGGINAPVR